MLALKMRDIDELKMLLNIEYESNAILKLKNDHQSNFSSIDNYQKISYYQRISNILCIIQIRKSINR